MGVRFLSQEWASELEDRLNRDPAFADAIAGRDVGIQQVIDTPDGRVDYWLRVADGKVAMGTGTLESPTATITQSYETAVGLARREINAVTAYMMGRIKIQGDLGTLMGLQSALGILADRMAEMDVDY